MKKSILTGLLVMLVILTCVGCGKEKATEVGKTDKEGQTTATVSNSIMTVNGIYLNNEYVDDDGLKQIVVFYDIKSDDENIDMSSTHFRMKINKNEYSAVSAVDTPNLTQYYYSDIIEKVYVGKSLKVAAVFEVPEGDLVDGKQITFVDFNDYAKGIKLSTNDIKRMDNLTDISLDVDKEYASKRQEEEKEKLTAADKATEQKVKKEINGYYFDIPSYIGTTYVNYELEFSSPNKFVVTSKASGQSISNKGTYEVTKGYIVLHYQTGIDNNVPYKFGSDGLTIENPFYSNGSDKIF